MVWKCRSGKHSLNSDQYTVVDLYGNGKTDFNEQAQEETPTKPVSAESPSTLTTTSTTTTTKSADTKPVVKPPQVIHTENSPGTGNNTTSAQQQHYPQPVQPTPNQLPNILTYEQPSDYCKLPAPHIDGGYQNIPITEWSVHPSEMKDAG